MERELKKPRHHYTDGELIADTRWVASITAKSTINQRDDELDGVCSLRDR